MDDSTSGQALVPDSRERRLFAALDLDGDGHVTLDEVRRVLLRCGLASDDPRLDPALAACATESGGGRFGIDLFCRATRPSIRLIERALRGDLVIPDFDDFAALVDAHFTTARANRGGRAASYIPELDLAEPEVDQFGLALCTVDGQRHSVGDAGRPFTIQSTCKPVSYCLALERHGPDLVHRHIGHEPSGARFNELTLLEDNRPHNPMINAGAIMSSALLLLDAAEPDQPFEQVRDRWAALAGGVRPGFSDAVFQSERATADRNFALAYFMREKGAFPPGVDLHQVLDLYFQCCSMEMTAEAMAVVAASLANGGICPVTGARVLTAETVKNCLSLMLSCGMYDYSGEFAFRIGLPAKSGVSGAVMIVVPNVMGLCSWSPRLDRLGNSVRGLDVCERLIAGTNFHPYDSLIGGGEKYDPRCDGIARRAEEMLLIHRAAARGDFGALNTRRLRGMPLDRADYDGRTPLHRAAAAGRADMIDALLKAAPDLRDVTSRWGATALDEAEAGGHAGAAELLRGGGARRGTGARLLAPQPSSMIDDAAVAELLWAASVGDVDGLRRRSVRGVPLGAADTDGRTALHVAAAGGHVDAVRFLLGQGVSPAPVDRWGQTPEDDARDAGHQAVARLL